MYALKYAKRHFFYMDVRYEALWSEISPAGKPLGPEAAVKFFRKSGLATKQLRAIWEECDTEEPLGTLEREEFFYVRQSLSHRHLFNPRTLSQTVVPSPLGPPVTGAQGTTTSGPLIYVDVHDSE